jgi:transposase
LRSTGRDRAQRRSQGKSDPLDALSAARAAQSGRATALPKGGDGAVEAIRTLMVTRRSARRDRTSTINQIRALLAAGLTICELVPPAGHPWR